VVVLLSEDFNVQLCHSDMVGVQATASVALGLVDQLVDDALVVGITSV
jgi:hypothetical protein